MYTVTIQGQAIAMTSPVKWILAYRTGLPPAQAKSLLRGRESGRRDELRQTVVNALVLQQVLERQPGIARLFHDLRFEIGIETSADLPGCPVVVVTSCLPSFRPADDLVAAATSFSGVPSFIELIDRDTIKQPRDLLRERLDELLE